MTQELSLNQIRTRWGARDMSHQELSRNLRTLDSTKTLGMSANTAMRGHKHALKVYATQYSYIFACFGCGMGYRVDKFKFRMSCRGLD